MTVSCWQCLDPVPRNEATWLGDLPYCDHCATVETGDVAHALDRAADR